jgi:serine/threonine-protein kinase ATR
MDVSQAELSNEETCLTYSCDLIEKFLAPAFRSASSSKAQDCLAYAIQELLRLCEFTQEIADISPGQPISDSKSQRLKKRWEDFAKPVIQIIKPLLRAKYYSLDTVPKHPIYPIFPQKTAFKDWLITWVIDLISYVYILNRFHLTSKIIQ